MLTCSICEGTQFQDAPILWDQLVSEWQLSPAERNYIDRQQGTKCVRCGANLRSIALADAIRCALHTEKSLLQFVLTTETKPSVLEINEAGNLHGVLVQMPAHTFATYPEIDMHAMPYADETFNLVVHSDTLEHVAHPVRALAECRRVLKSGGYLCFTIPTVIGRLTRSRAGLPPSYHGNAASASDDLLVQTEFGADMWTCVLLAGFDSVAINAVEFPAALALSARKP